MNEFFDTNFVIVDEIFYFYLYKLDGTKLLKLSYNNNNNNNIYIIIILLFS